MFTLQGVKHRVTSLIKNCFGLMGKVCEQALWVVACDVFWVTILSKYD